MRKIVTTVHLPILGPNLIIANLSGYFFILDVVDLDMVRWFGGLTCDFWAENRQKKK